MKYENARDILPAKLLEEVQKYVEGKTIYIPRTVKSRSWGESSGYRDKLARRNALICSRYSAGQSVFEIAEEFFLSPETVKKLVYGKKVALPVFSRSVASAEQYAAAGMGEEWVRVFLHSCQQEMPDISEFFMSELVKIPLRLISTEENRIHPGTAMTGFDVPLIVMFSNASFSVPCQAEYLACLKEEKRNSHYAFVFVKNDDYAFFWQHFGKHFQR